MSKWRVVTSLMLVIAGTAAPVLGQPPAAPAATGTPRPSADEQRRYGAALARARNAERAGNLKLAAKGFADCLEILPDDPVALGELGVVQLRAGQLVDAEATSRKAIEHSQSPTVRAAALFNLGYILARRGDTTGAIEAYQSSLRLRASPTVAAELRKLDPAAAATMRLVPRPMHPAPSDTSVMLRERCWKVVAEAWPELGATAADVSAEHFHYACGEVPTRLSLAGTPILEARVLRSSSVYAQYPKHVLSLAIRTQKGWFTAPLEQMWVNRWGEGDLQVTAVELTSVGDRPAIVVRWDTSWDEWPWDSDPARAYPNGPSEGRIVIDHKLAIASLGPSGTPSVTPSITIGFAAGFGEKRKPLVRASMKPVFDPAGGLTLGPPILEPTKIPRKKFADLLDPLIPGKLELGFP
ncbi:MAG TPA: tetratricopeptide repeat protein [Kofleriaceae bacterium]|nr:tetratricopeptide repeat protein [Kofleriaceae bacterium]